MQKNKPNKNQSPDESKRQLNSKELISEIVKKKTKEKFLTINQKKFYDTLISSEITVCSGPAGVGKSYITMKAAIDLIANPSTPY